MAAGTVTLKISGATYDAADVEMLWSWVAEGRVPDDSQIRISGSSFGPAPDVLFSLISAELDASQRPSASLNETEQSRPLGFPQIAQNAYRMLGMPGDATLAQLRAVEARVRRHQELGRRASAASELSALGHIDPDLRSVTEAVARLDDPLKRVRERAWWFLRADDLSRAQTGHSSDFKEKHSTLLHAQIELAVSDPSVQKSELWRSILGQWRELFDSPMLSDVLLALDTHCGFERRLRENDAANIHAILHDDWPALFRWLLNKHIAGQDHVSLARALVVARDVDMPIAQDMKDGIGAELERIVAPSFQRAYTFLSRVNRTERATPIINQFPITAAERVVVEDICPTIDLFAAALSYDDLKVAEARDAATELLYSIAVASTWTDDFARAKRHLSTAAERTTPNSPLGEKIAEMAGRVEETRRRNAVFEGSRPPDNPTLYTFNGIGATFYGSSDFDATTNSYITTHYFVALFIPLFALARYRVIQPQSGKYQMLAKYPLTKANKWHSAISLAIILCVLVIVSMSSSTSQQNGQSATTAASIDSPTKSRLAEMKREIEANRAEMDRFNKLTDAEKTELETIERGLTALKGQIASIEADYGTGLEVDRDEYKRLLAAHNRNVERYNALLVTQKGHIDAYNTLLAADGQRVAEYNALLRSAR